MNDKLFVKKKLLVAAIFLSLAICGSTNSVSAHSGSGTSPVTQASTLLKAGKTDQAITNLKSYLKGKNAKDAQTHYLLGTCYVKKQEYAKARKHFRIAIRLGRGNQYSQKANQQMMKVPKKYIKPRTGPMTRFLASLFGFGRHRGAGAKPTPTVIDFYASWCHPCKKLDKTLASLSSKYGDKVKIMKVDVDDPKNDQIVDQYEISPIPTVIFLNTDGEVVDYSIGYSGEKGLTKGFNKILADGSGA